MNFRDPFWLPFFVLVPCLWFLLRLGLRRRRQRLALFAEPSLLQRLLPAERRWGFLGKHLLWVLAAAAIILALAGPQWGYATRPIRVRGADLVIALDVSQSMAATDVQPNRLTKAKREIVDVLDSLTGDRVALVAFAGDAYVQCPLTMDYDAIRLFLDSVDTNLVPRQGTSFKRALEVSHEALIRGAENDERSGAILILSDAEDQDESPDAVLNNLANKGIKVFGYAIGSTAGAPVPEAQGGGFKRLDDGSLVNSRVHPELLSHMAKLSGGKSWQATASPGELADYVRTELRPVIGEREGQERQERLPILRLALPLLLALFLLLAEMALSPWRKPGLEM